MSLNFSDASSHGIAFKYVPAPPSSMPLEHLRNVIHELNVVSDDCGCAVFGNDGRKSNNVVIFAGNLERFAMLSAARHLDARVFYFQDTESWWYGGSRLLPDLRKIHSFLDAHIGRANCLVFGQSSGGYAALAMGAMAEHYDVLACSPQTFADGEFKRRLQVSGQLAVQKTPDHLIDIAEAYGRGRRSGVAAAIFSASEFANPYQSHFWLDHMHMMRILGIEAINTFMAASANHSIVMQRADLFAQALSDLIGISRFRKRHRIQRIQRLVNEISQAQT